MAELRQTGFLDDFQRPDENPLSWDGRWQSLRSTTGNELALTSHFVCIIGVAPNSSQASYWQPDVWYGDVECWGQGSGGNDLSEGLSLFLHVYQTRFQTGGNELLTGYQAQWSDDVIGGPHMTLYRYNGGGARTTLAGPTPGAFDCTGGLNLFRRIGNTLEAWTTSDPTGLTGWSLLISATDSTYSYGFVGLGTQNDDENPGWAGFGGGSLNRSRIIRYVSN